jgi:hypothetical protein
MLRWFRSHASCIATIALVALATLGVTAVTPHADDCHDSACLPIAVEHDADAHRVGAPASGDDAQPFHCLVCHVLRSFRPQVVARALVSPVVDAGVIPPIESFETAMAAQAIQPPLRAPPLTPLL